MVVINEEKRRFMNDFVIKGDVCYSLTPTELDLRNNAYVVCVGGVSAGVFDTLPKEYEQLPLLDFSGKLIFPGMVDLHTHAPQYSYRGMCMDLELMDWLRSYTFPEEAKYADLDYAKEAYSAFAGAVAKGATTRVNIFATRHKEATALLMDIMENSGVISYVGKVNMDRGAAIELIEKDAQASADETLSLIRETAGKYKRTAPIITPRFIPSCTDELMRLLGDVQNETGVPVQSHLSENEAEIAHVKQLRPQNKFYGECYNDHGMFGKGKNGSPVNTVMAHCVWSSPEELMLMKENGVYVAHCPSSNMNLASGIAPIRKYLDMGLNVGLGTDVAAGHSDSIFRAMTDAIQLSKLYYRHVDKSCRPIVFAEAFYMATKGGGKFFGKVGGFEAGYELDAIVLDDSSLATTRELTLAQRAERAVYLGLDSHGIVAKIVNAELGIGN